MHKNYWLFTILIVVAILAAFGVVLLALVDDDSQFQPLFDFCWDQLQSEVDDCANWAFAFADVYGDRPALPECLQAFESDSPLLLMCMDNIVAGRQ